MRWIMWLWDKLATQSAVNAFIASCWIFASAVCILIARQFAGLMSSPFDE